MRTPPFREPHFEGRFIWRVAGPISDFFAQLWSWHTGAYNWATKSYFGPTTLQINLPSILELSVHRKCTVDDYLDDGPKIEPNHYKSIQKSTNRTEPLQFEPNQNISSIRTYPNHSIEQKTFLRDNNGDLVLIPLWTVIISIGVGGNTTSSSPALILYNIMEMSCDRLRWACIWRLKRPAAIAHHRSTTLPAL